jgi:FkbM family methyltransferase|tara:strand:+ start:1535 stop:2173 length:639 start_codon:yes stop_codon:yes gene_type:complete
MEELIVRKPCGLWWPQADAKFNNSQWEIPVPKDVSAYCTETNVCVQAGGRCGTYPILYSKFFKTVYTFEPEPLNFYCMQKNVTQDNIIMQQACLGDSFKNVNVAIPLSRKHRNTNIGTYQVSGDGAIPMITIDSLNLDQCNLIHLDIEGYEGFAINGAINTIKKFKPVICLEVNGLGKAFGFSGATITSMLAELNYSYKITVGDDMLFVCNG